MKKLIAIFVLIVTATACGVSNNKFDDLKSFKYINSNNQTSVILIWGDNYKACGFSASMQLFSIGKFKLSKVGDSTYKTKWHKDNPSNTQYIIEFRDDGTILWSTNFNDVKNVYVPYEGRLVKKCKDAPSF